MNTLFTYTPASRQHTSASSCDRASRPTSSVKFLSLWANKDLAAKFDTAMQPIRRYVHRATLIGRFPLHREHSLSPTQTPVNSAFKAQSLVLYRPGLTFRIILNTKAEHHKEYQNNITIPHIDTLPCSRQFTWPLQVVIKHVRALFSGLIKVEIIIYLYQQMHTHTHTHTYIYYNIKLCHKSSYMLRCFCTNFKELWYCVC